MRDLVVVSTSGFIKTEGIGSVLYGNLKNFQQPGRKIYLISSQDDSQKVLDKFREIGVQITKMPNRKKSPLKYYYRLYLTLKKINADAFYINGSSSIMGIDLFVAKLAGYSKRIGHSHNTKNEHYLIHRILHPILAMAVTDEVACGYDAGKFLYRNDRFVVVKNGRDINNFKFSNEERLNKRNDLEIGSDVEAIGHVGAFNDQKNQRYLIELFKEYHQLNPNTLLFMAGVGENVEEVRALVKKYNLTSSVKFMLSVDDMRPFLSAMDKMVLPSKFEGIPLVVVEWQLSGLPIFMSDRVSDEVVFTPDVKCFSLDNSVKSNAKKLSLIKSRNWEQRIIASDNNTKQAIEEGFDLKENSHSLEKIIDG